MTDVELDIVENPPEIASTKSLLKVKSFFLHHHHNEMTNHYVKGLCSKFDMIMLPPEQVHQAGIDLAAIGRTETGKHTFFVAYCGKISDLETSHIKKMALGGFDAVCLKFNGHFDFDEGNSIIKRIRQAKLALFADFGGYSGKKIESFLNKKLICRLNGVLLHNLSMKDNGRTYNLFEDFDYLNLLSREIQQRRDFIALGHECADRSILEASLIERFKIYCADHSIIGQICVADHRSQICAFLEPVFTSNVTPLQLLDAPEVVEFGELVRRLPVAIDDEPLLNGSPVVNLTRRSSDSSSSKSSRLDDLDGDGDTTISKPLRNIFGPPEELGLQSKLGLEKGEDGEKDGEKEKEKKRVVITIGSDDEKEEEEGGEGEKEKEKEKDKVASDVNVDDANRIAELELIEEDSVDNLFDKLITDATENEDESCLECGWIDRILEVLETSRLGLLSYGAGHGEEMHVYALECLKVCSNLTLSKSERKQSTSKSEEDYTEIIDTLVKTSSTQLESPWLRDMEVASVNGAPMYSAYSEDIDNVEYIRALQKERKLQDKLLFTARGGPGSFAEMHPDLDLNPSSGLGPSSRPKLSGQKEIGFEHDESDYDTVVGVMRSLREANLLDNLSEVKQIEVAGDDPQHNIKKEMKSTALMEILDRLKSITVPNAHAMKLKSKSRKSKLDPSDPRFQLKDLPLLLTKRHRIHMNFMQVQLWAVDKAGLVSNDRRYYAVSEVAKDILHIYIRKDHPNMAEAVVHQFLQSRGFNNQQCVLAEHLVRKTDLKNVTSGSVPGSAASGSGSGAETSMPMGVGAGGAYQVYTLVEAVDEEASRIVEETDELMEYIGEGLESLSLISDRIIHQIENSNIYELVGNIQRFRKVVRTTEKRKDISMTQKRNIIKLAREVTFFSTSRMIQMSKSSRLVSGFVDKLVNMTSSLSLYRNRNPMRNRKYQNENEEHANATFVHLFSEACWRADAMKKVRMLLKLINGVMKFTGTSSIMYKGIFLGLQQAQHAGLMQFEMLIRDSVPFLIREIDVATVLTEMNGHSDEDQRRRFQIGKHQVGEVLYRRIRRSMEAEDEGEIRYGKLGPDTDTESESDSENENGGEGEGAVDDDDDKKKKKSEEKKEKKDTADNADVDDEDKEIMEGLSGRQYLVKYADGLFFMFPFTINLLLALITGTGLFSSTNMDQRDQWDAGIGMILGFLISGMINWSIARIGSWYFFQWSYSVLVVVFSRLLWMGFLAISIVGAIVGGATGSYVVFLYCILIGSSQLLIGALFNTRTNTIWYSIGGLSILLGLALSLIYVVIMTFVVKYPNALVVHLTAQVILVAILLIALIYICHGLISKFDHISPSSDAVVMDFYEKNKQKPFLPPPDINKAKGNYDELLIEWFLKVNGDGEDMQSKSKNDMLIEAKKEVVRLKRDSRSEFAKAVSKLVDVPKLFSFVSLFFSRAHPEVKRRAREYSNEQNLLQWYSYLTGKDNPDLYSVEYEAYLNEAHTAMDIKRKTDVMHRGGLLFVATGKYLLHGLFYFLLLFSDRIVRYILSSSSGDLSSFPFFLPTSQYELAIGWAQFLLLLAVGTLETLPSRKKLLEDVQDLRILKHGAKSLKLFMAHQLKVSRRIWRSELLLNAKFSMVATIFVIGIMFITLDKIRAEEFILFGFASVGYLAFTLGGYNLLFSGNVGGHGTRGIIIAVFTALVSGFASILGCRYGQVDWSSVGLPGLKNEDLAVVSTFVGGLVYGILSLPMFAKEAGLDVEWELASSKAPLMTTAMQTSGQHWITSKVVGGTKGSDGDGDGKGEGVTINDKLTRRMNRLQPSIGEANALAVEKMRYKYLTSNLLQNLLSSNSIGSIEISAETGTGTLVCGLLDEAIRNWNDAADNSLEKRSFPDGGRQLSKLKSRYESGRIRIVSVEQRHLSIRMNDRVVYSAMSRSRHIGTEGVKQLEIIVAVDRDRSEMEKSLLIAEALLHEGFEQIFGYPHQYASLSELLVHLADEGGGDVDAPIPSRILMELEHCSDVKLVDVIRQTDSSVLSSSLMYITTSTADDQLDLVWDKLGPSSRAICVGLVRRVLSEEPLSPVRLKAYLKMESGAYQKGVTELLDFMPALDKKYSDYGQYSEEEWDRRLALAELAARLALYIKNEARKQLRSRMFSSTVQRVDKFRDVDYQYDSKDDKAKAKAKASENMNGDDETQVARKVRSFDTSTRIVCYFDSIFRLLFLAMTGDVSYPVELYHASRLTMRDGGLDYFSLAIAYIVFTLLFFVSKFGSHLIADLILLFQWRLRNVKQQLRSGTSRSLAYEKVKVSTHGDHEEYRLMRVTSQDLVEPLTAFVHYVDADTEGEKSEVGSRAFVYRGVFDMNEPTDAKNRIGTHEYRKMYPRRMIKMSTQVGVTVSRTSFYTYGSELSTIPLQRQDYIGDLDREPENQHDSDKWVESLAYDSIGRIVSSVFRIPYPYSDDSTKNKNKTKTMTVEGLYRHRHRIGTGSTADSSAIVHSYRFKMKSSGRTGNVSGSDGDGDGDSDDPDGSFAYAYRRMDVFFYPKTNTIRKVRLQANDNRILETVYSYAHPRHPTHKTYLIESNGKVLREHETPNVIENDTLGLLKRKPVRSFMHEDLCMSKIPGSSVKRKMQKGVKYVNISTSPYTTRQARSLLWREWERGRMEGVFAQMMEEGTLRRETILRPYYRLRDWGFVKRARRYIHSNEGSIATVIDFGLTTSHLAIRVADLFICMEGGSSHYNGELPKKFVEEDFDNENEDEDEDMNNHNDDIQDESADVKWSLRFDEKTPLHVIGLDSGTWPSDGGGVASCRRDLVNRLPRIRWTMNAEIGSPMKLVQRSYQIETNVTRLTFTPMWGCELGGPIQSVLSSEPFARLSMRAYRTTPAIINKLFVPILTQLTNFAGFTVSNVREREQVSNLFVSFYYYFQNYDWDATWQSPLVTHAWRSTWLNILSRTSGQLNIELPTLEDIDFALSTLIHFFMPLTSPIPAKPVIQSSHHGLQAVVGAVAKRIHGTGFCVWDHGVLWRERLTAISQVEAFSLFVRNVLIDFTRLAVSIVLHNADCVIPVSTISNPEWEERLLGGPRNQDSTTMKRKISPVLNGMETDRFSVNRESESVSPTAVMLSHVYDLKDVKTAIRAVPTILHEYGVRSYRLLIYGSLDKDLAYVDECRSIIADLGIGDNVELMGLGNASKVLPTGWLFLNSSKSEGLPLALGEAGLAGLPVVCTDVGGSREVITDTDTTGSKKIYGAISPAQDPRALADAQVKVMSMSHGDGEGVDGGGLQGEDLLTRMYEKKIERQRLGMQFRAFVLQHFPMKRYLREHEQLLWICAQKYRERCLISEGSSSNNNFKPESFVKDENENAGSPAQAQAQAQMAGQGQGQGQNQTMMPTYVRFLRDLNTPGTVINLWNRDGDKDKAAKQFGFGSDGDAGEEDGEEEEEDEGEVLQWYQNENRPSVPTLSDPPTKTEEKTNV